MEEIDSALVGVPTDQHAEALDDFFAGPTNCRACLHADAGPVTHEFEDGGWWHEIVLGEVPVVTVDSEDQDWLRVDLMRHHSSAACVGLAGKGQCMELNLAGVRQAVRLLALAERLLTAEAAGGGDGALAGFDSKSKIFQIWWPKL